MLEDRGALLWRFLDSSSMLDWSTVAVATVGFDDDCAFEDLVSEGEAEAGEISTAFDCNRTRIQLLTFEVLAQRIREAAEEACPQISKLMKRVEHHPHDDIASASSLSDENADPTSCHLEEDKHASWGADAGEAVDAVSKARAAAPKNKSKNNKEVASNAGCQQPKLEGKRSRPAPARTAYQLFAVETMCNPSDAKDAWRALPADDRRGFEEAAVMDKHRFREEMEEWQKKKDTGKPSRARQDKFGGTGRRR
jgi:hypothetical protein